MSKAKHESDVTNRDMALHAELSSIINGAYPELLAALKSYANRSARGNNEFDTHYNLGMKELSAMLLYQGSAEFLKELEEEATRNAGEEL